MKIIKTDQVYIFDQFYTKTEVAKECVSELIKLYNWTDFDLCVEPGAGTGSFYDLLPEKKRVGIEIDKNLCEKNKEYLNISFFDYMLEPGKYLVIGNPPFGTQNKLAIEFFNYAAEFAEVIAFIVPRTWKKPQVQSRLNINFNLYKSIDLSQDAFVGRKDTNVRCCFQIWEKVSQPRTIEKLLKTHSDWQFLQYIHREGDIYPPKEADFVVLAYGSGSGEISKDLFRWRPKSVHFIKSNIDTNILIERFNNMDYSVANDSARQSSLGRASLVKLYTEKYGE